MNLEGQRTTKTLYVGNLDYNSDSGIFFAIGSRLMRLEFLRTMANLEDMLL